MAAGPPGGDFAAHRGLARRLCAGRHGRAGIGGGADFPGAPVAAGRPSVIAGSPEAAAIAMGSTLLIPFALAGLALINVGMVRSRNAAHIMMSSLCVIGIAAIAYFVCGFSWQGVTGAPGFALHIGGKPWDWIAGLPWFWRGLDWTGSPAALVIFMQIFSVALAAMIPLGGAG